MGELQELRHHEWDDDGCCVHCGFDGAEWHWWKHSTYEGRAQPEARQPPCKERRITEAELGLLHTPEETPRLSP